MYTCFGPFWGQIKKKHNHEAQIYTYDFFVNVYKMTRMLRIVLRHDVRILIRHENKVHIHSQPQFYMITGQNGYKPKRGQPY